MSTILVNPMNEIRRERQQPARRLATLSGKTVALLDISKPGGRVFLDRLSELLTAHYGVNKIRRLTKPTYTKQAPNDLIAKLSGQYCDAVIEALAD